MRGPCLDAGRSCLLYGNGTARQAANAFFASGRMRNLSEGINRKYAYSLCTWINFFVLRDKGGTALWRAICSASASGGPQTSATTTASPGPCGRAIGPRSLRSATGRSSGLGPPDCYR